MPFMVSRKIALPFRPTDARMTLRLARVDFGFREASHG